MRTWAQRHRQLKDDVAKFVGEGGSDSVESTKLKQELEELRKELAEFEAAYTELDDQHQQLVEQAKSAGGGSVAVASLPDDAAGLLAERLHALMLEENRSTSTKAIERYAAALVESPISAWFRTDDAGADAG